MFRSPKKFLLISGIVLWLSATGWGMKWLASYSFTPGKAGSPAEQWPKDAVIPRPLDKLTLVVALHPECPCSRATVAELDSILVQTKSALNVVIIFSDLLPDEPVQKSDLYQKARELTGARILSDSDGSWMRKFAFRTSGEVRLYRPDGALVFRGGITAGRGHEGDNPGQKAVIALTLNPSGLTFLPEKTPVFGCSLTND